MRKVEIEYEGQNFERCVCVGWFHQWSLDSQYQHPDRMHLVGIIELEDGSIVTRVPSRIRFIQGSKERPAPLSASSGGREL